MEFDFERLSSIEKVDKRFYIDVLEIVELRAKSLCQFE